MREETKLMRLSGPGAIVAWLNERTLVDPLRRVRALDAYQDYREWSINRGLIPFNLSHFGRGMARAGVISSRSTRGRRVYLERTLRESLGPGA